ncbi:MAG: hypothetical protein ACREON_15630 [Gemmatimonadaceae bacterium]
MSRSIDRAVLRRAACLLALALPARQASAQGSLFERLNLDRLRLTALGVAAGPVSLARVEGTESYAIQADYGEIARNWRALFVVSYWGSRFKRETVREFEEQLARSITDPSGDDVIEVGEVRVSDIALEAELRWTPRERWALRPYLGGAFGAHVINAESPFIEGTFVESALDNINTGLSGVIGLETAPLGRLSFGVQARYTLLSNVRFGALRAGATYNLSPRRRNGE